MAKGSWLTKLPILLLVSLVLHNIYLSNIITFSYQSGISPPEIVIWKDHAKKPLTYVYCVGVEGSGHHLLISFLSQLKPFFPHDDTHMKMRIKQNDIWGLATFPWQKEGHIEDYKNYLKMYSNRVVQDSLYTHIYEDNSYPYLNPRNG